MALRFKSKCTDTNTKTKTAKKNLRKHSEEQFNEEFPSSPDSDSEGVPILGLRQLSVGVLQKCIYQYKISQLNGAFLGDLCPSNSIYKVTELAEHSKTVCSGVC